MTSKVTKLCLLAFTLSSVAHAQSIDDIPQSAPAPDTEEIESSLLSNNRVSLFARVYKLSGLSLQSFDSRYVTFLAPLDAACNAEQRFHMEHVTSKKTAIDYIRDHVFYGSIAKFDGRRPRINYRPAGAEPTSPPTTVVLADSEEFRDSFASGKPLLLNYRDGKLILGVKSELVGGFGGVNGSIEYMNDCDGF